MVASELNLIVWHVWITLTAVIAVLCIVKVVSDVCRRPRPARRVWRDSIVSDVVAEALTLIVVVVAAITFTLICYFASLSPSSHSTNNTEHTWQYASVARRYHIMELFKAHSQWSTRPADETFANVQTAFDAAKQYAAVSKDKADVPLQSVRTEAVNNEVNLTGRGGVPARVSHWAFGQLARIADAPAGYLRSLPATLAAQNLNHGLKRASDADQDAKVNILAHLNGSLLVRALTSNKYARIWNYEVLGRMLPLEQEGWTCPTPFRTRADQQAKPDPTVYVSDHDMFAFLVREDIRIAEPGNADGLARGFFVENSEVGASALRITTFLYRYMCANHIVWGAKDVTELAVRHIGKARGNLSTMFLGLTEYANESASDLEAKIKVAKTRLIDADKEKVLDVVFAKLRGQVSRDAIMQSQELAEMHHATDGDPRSFWGLAQGMTRYSQTLKFADARVAVDKAAADVIDLAF